MRDDVMIKKKRLRLSTREKLFVFDRLVALLKEQRLNILYVLFHLDCVGVGGLDEEEHKGTGEELMDDFLDSLSEGVLVEICRKALPDLLIGQFGAEKVSIKWKSNTYAL